MTDPPGPHLDTWGVLLAAAAVILGLVGLTVRRNVADHWAHHPFRVVVQGHLANVFVGSALAVALGALSHDAGWPIYGLPAVGLAILTLSLGVVLAGVWALLFHVHRQMARYDERYPLVAAADLDTLPKVRRPRSGAPTYWAFGLAAAAYFVFVWHPWPHIFHEGNFVFGAPAGFAIGSVFAMFNSPVAAPAPPRTVRSRQRGSKRRR